MKSKSEMRIVCDTFQVQKYIIGTETIKHMWAEIIFSHIQKT